MFPIVRQPVDSGDVADLDDLPDFEEYYSESGPIVPSAAAAAASSSSPSSLSSSAASNVNQYAASSSSRPVHAASTSHSCPSPSSSLTGSGNCGSGNEPHLSLVATYAAPILDRSRPIFVYHMAISADRPRYLLEHSSVQLDGSTFVFQGMFLYCHRHFIPDIRFDYLDVNYHVKFSPAQEMHQVPT